MNQPLAQATGTPRLRGTTVVLPPVPAPSWWGKDSRSRRDVSIDSCDPASFDSMFWVPSASRLSAPITSMLDKPLCLLWWESTQGVNVARERWPQIGLLAWDVQGLETIPLPLWDGTRNGKQKEPVSWADPLLECFRAGPQNEDDLMIGQSGGWWLSKGWRQEDPKSRMGFYHPEVNSPLLLFLIVYGRFDHEGPMKVFKSLILLVYLNYYLRR